MQIIFGEIKLRLLDSYHHIQKSISTTIRRTLLLLVTEFEANHTKRINCEGSTNMDTTLPRRKGTDEF